MRKDKCRNLKKNKQGRQSNIIILYVRKEKINNEMIVTKKSMGVG